MDRVGGFHTRPAKTVGRLCALVSELQMSWDARGLQWTRTARKSCEMNRSLIKLAAYVQIVLAIVSATGCSTTQPFFAHETPELQHYLSAATRVEYPDVQTESLAETVNAQPPLTLGNHAYTEYWDLELEECISIALQNAKFFVTTTGNSELRQNVGSQFISGTADQFGSIYDVAVQQTRTQSIPLTIDGNGNRTLPRGVLRANQIGGVEDALAEFDAQTSGFVSWGNTDRARNTGPTTHSIHNCSKQSMQRSSMQSASEPQRVAWRLCVNRLSTSQKRGLGQCRSRCDQRLDRSTRSPSTASLMRNRGTMINRIPVVLASLNEDISIAEFEVQVPQLGT